MSRLALGLDTATDAVAVAIGRLDDDDRLEVIAAGDVVARRASLSRALPIAQALLDAQGLAPADLEVVAVGRGPGSYTGVRIGLAAAKGLAHGLGVPLVGVGTLDVVAWSLSGRLSGLLGVVGDAMRGEVYPALFELSDGAARRLGPDTVERPEDVARRWADETDGPLILAGDGLAKHADVLTAALGDRGRLAPEADWLPTGAGVLAAAAAEGPRAGAPAGAVLPVYTRLSDAEHREPGRQTDVPASGVAGPDGGDA